MRLFLKSEQRIARARSSFLVLRIAVVALTLIIRKGGFTAGTGGSEYTVLGLIHVYVV